MAAAEDVNSLLLVKSLVISVSPKVKRFNLRSLSSIQQIWYKWLYDNGDDYINADQITHNDIESLQEESSQ